MNVAMLVILLAVLYQVFRIRSAVDRIEAYTGGWYVINKLLEKPTKDEAMYE